MPKKVKNEIVEEEKVADTLPETEEVNPSEEVVDEEPSKEETPVKEVKEEKVEVKPASNSEVVEINKLNPDDEPFDVDIENHRQILFNQYGKAKKSSNIIMLSVVAVVIGAMVLIFLGQDWSRITGYAIAGVVLVGMIVYSILTKNKFPNRTKEYIRYVTTKTNQFVYNNTEFQEVKVDYAEKYNLQEVSCDRIYKNCIEIGSRNIVKGKYNDKGFSCGELALYSPKGEGKKQTKEVAFIGKYISVNNTLHFENRYIISLRGEKPTDLPTDIEDLTILHEDGNLCIYGPEGKDYKNDIPTKYINEIKKISVEGHLLNLNVVLWAGHTGIYLSYDDPVISLPFDKPFDSQTQVMFKQHLLNVLDAEKIINK
mgnify:CR=1 FL=1